MGVSIPDVPLDFCSSAFFFLAAAKACNFDIFGAPSDEPPNRPPLGPNGGVIIACRSTGILNHGASAKKSLNENDTGLGQIFVSKQSYSVPTYQPSPYIFL